MAQPEPVCAYCRRHVIDPAWRPFCSERCKLADLGRWISGEYRVPGPPVTADEEDAE
ncbi:MAG: DNA gyrase inhibitor YacG [Acidobacteriota bacterium]